MRQRIWWLRRLNGQTILLRFKKKPRREGAAGLLFDTEQQLRGRSAAL
jgi:hypothetical protein